MSGIDTAKHYIGLNTSDNDSELKTLLKSEAVNYDIAIDPANVSWCAAFMNFCERSVGNPGTGELNAQSFGTYGERVIDNNTAEEGDILVFHFPFDQEWQGHVTYFVNWNSDGSVTCLGGNQDHSVKYSNYGQQFITHIRRPN